MPETSARCLYATRPADRPDCQLTPVVTYATVPLCASCDRQRSTLGKGHRPRRLTPTQRLEPLDLITHTQTELHTAQQNLHAAVVRARQNGQPWSAIANRLGVTRQAAQQRFSQLDIYRSICGTFARRVGIGGPCPHCDQPVALNDLLDPEGVITVLKR